MTPAKVANVVAHTGMDAARALDLVTGRVRLSYRARCCRVRFALVVASCVHHDGEPTEACACEECAPTEKVKPDASIYLARISARDHTVSCEPLDVESSGLGTERAIETNMSNYQVEFSTTGEDPCKEDVEVLCRCADKASAVVEAFGHLDLTGQIAWIRDLATNQILGVARA
jgi:hypothetical protein